MAESRWLRLAQLLDGARRCDGPEELDAYLVQECAGDATLKEEVEALLEASRLRPDFADPPSIVDSDLAGRRFDGLEILDELGRGGMGIVYRARQLDLDREVAVKVLPLLLKTSDAVAERFRREAVAASRLDHPGIATVLSYGEVDGTLYYAMELIDGLSLREAMDRAAIAPGDPRARGLRDERRIARLARDVAIALDFAHEHGVIHRDVKPGNILIDERGKPHVIDFGVALLFDQLSITLTGELTGTLQYMSPEQAGAIEATIDRRADVYSLGAVLYELLAGRPPVEGTTRHQLLHQIAHATPPPISRVRPGVARDLETICAKALEQQPDDRYPSAASMAADLEAYLRREPILARPTPTLERMRRGVLKRRTVIQAAGIGLGVGALGAGWAAFGHGERPRTRVAVRLVGGDDARFELWRRTALHDRFEERVATGQVVDGERRFDLDTTDHQLVLTDDDGRTAQLLLPFLGESTERTYDVRLTRTGDVEDAMVLCVPRGPVDGRFQPLDVRKGFPGKLLSDPLGFTVDVAPFYVDRHCVTNDAFRAFLDAVGKAPEDVFEGDLVEIWRNPPIGFGGLPVVFVRFPDALHYAAWSGKRLPTSAEYLAFTYGSDASWIDSLARSNRDDLHVGVLPTAPPEIAYSIAGYLEHARPADSGPDQGPHGIKHAIGNTDIWTASPGSVRPGEATEFVATWHSRIVSYHNFYTGLDHVLKATDDPLNMHSVHERFVTLGLRCVKSVPF